MVTKQIATWDTTIENYHPATTLPGFVNSLLSPTSITLGLGAPYNQPRR